MFGLSEVERPVFRSNSAYHVVLFDRLSAPERERLAPLRRDPNFYGVIAPCDPSSARALLGVSRDVALLLLTLQQPGPLPSYVADANDPELERLLEQLVLDGVLEVRSHDGFVSGPAALRGLASQAVAGRIARLSHAALVYASAVDVEGDDDVEALLYRFNHTPLTPALSACIPTGEALRDFLRLDRGPTSALLAEHWTEYEAKETDAWIQWSAAGHDVGLDDREPTFKVYVSPTFAALPDAFARTVAVLADAGVYAFKVGGTARDLARADKLVIYFRDREHALDCGVTIAAELAGLPAQGVPFTAELGSDGLVSWGVDPGDRVGRQSESSWRRWVCRRLARYIAVARERHDDDVPPWRFALERLRLDGVDTARWEPDVTRFARERWASA
jgi:hypothetical protein